MRSHLFCHNSAELAGVQWQWNTASHAAELEPPKLSAVLSCPSKSASVQAEGATRNSHPLLPHWRKAGGRVAEDSFPRSRAETTCSCRLCCHAHQSLHPGRQRARYAVTPSATLVPSWLVRAGGGNQLPMQLS